MIDINQIKIENSWKNALRDEFLSRYFDELKAKFISAKAQNTVYPPNSLIFNAFNLTPFDTVKIVILGQDPYHGANQAMGLSFSVPNGVKIPPSLMNIYKEIYNDLGIKEPQNGDLTYFAKQGILLLNSTLSVNANSPNSHKDFGWQRFTDAAISALSQKREHIVFMLWGNFAKAKARFIDTSKHLILSAPHPSPLAHGFLGCKHFSKANDYLTKFGIKPIDWDLNNAKNLQ